MMKRSIQLLFLLTLAHAAMAQEDFYSQYMIRLSGVGSTNGDPNINCGSGFQYSVIFENGDRSVVVPLVGVDAPSSHNFSGFLVFSSQNKVKSLLVYTKDQRKHGLSESCEGGTITEREIIFNPQYPCQNRTMTHSDGSYNFSTTIEIQPLSKKSIRLSTRVDMRNNANEEFADHPYINIYQPPARVGTYKTQFSYSVRAVFENDSSGTLLSGGIRWLTAGTTISGQHSMIVPLTKKPAAITLASQGTVELLVRTDTEGGGEAEYTTVAARLPSPALHNFALSDLPVPGSTSFDFSLYPNASPGRITVTTTTFSIPIKYGPDATNILPYDTANRITILGPAGNPPSFYHWVYSADGATWSDLPQKFQGRHRLSISGYDLQGEDFMKHHNTNVFFKLIMDCNGGESEVLTLSRRISAPNIVSVAPMPDRCFDTPRDGAFHITFSRPLLVHPGGARENLTILVRDLSNTNPPDQIIDVTLDAGNSLTWPRRLESGRQYEISLVDTYLGAFAFSDNKLNHYDTVALERPLPVTSILTPEPVHCYNGADGKIHITAQGGAGNYSYEYVRPSGETLQGAFGTSATGVIELLSPGAYTVSLRDSNNCGDRAGTRNVVITQPPAPLQIAYTATTDPRAFGYTDGYIETILTGGTPYADRHYTVQWYNPANLLPDSLQNNAVLSEGYQANIDSLGDGAYIVSAYDSQYEAAHPDHRAGCYVQSEILRLNQPPPMIVTVREHHVVTCNGYSDGALAARAQGGIKRTGAWPYQYEWLAAENGTLRPITQTDSVATGLKSGVYHIRITDKNNIEKISEPFTLVQPDVLQAQVTGTPVSCNAGMDGTAEALVQGGTLPYAYEWSQGSIAPQVAELPEGTYFVLIADVRGCTTTASGKITSPHALQVDSVLRAPQCAGYADGGIDITVTEGTAPYQYQWSTGAVSEDIEGLTEGRYEVMITDRNQCRSYRAYVLTDPEPVQIQLGNERYLCNGQSYEADASLADPGAQYQWSGPGGFAATTGNVTIAAEGTYRVNVTDSNGCTGADELVVRRIGTDIGAEFVVTTQAFADTEVTLLNLSTPAPDSSQWWVAGRNDISITRQQDSKATLVFPGEGVYTLYLKAYRQGCEAVFSTAVTVLGASYDMDEPVQTSFVEKFTASPNPAHDAFTVTVSLQEAASIRLRLLSMVSNIVVHDRRELGSDQYVLPYTVNLPPGIYLLMLESPRGSNLVKVIVY